MSNIISRALAPLANARAFRMAIGAFALTMAASFVHAAETMPVPAATEATTVFRSYQNWRDEPLLDWREANDRVGEIGGWLTYMRELQDETEGMDSGRHDHSHHHGH